MMYDKRHIVKKTVGEGGSGESTKKSVRHVTYIAQAHEKHFHSKRIHVDEALHRYHT